jgi:hypothetical protein
VLPRDGVSVGEFRMDFEGVAGASSRWIGTECMTVGWLVGWLLCCTLLLAAVTDATSTGATVLLVV